MTPEKTDDEIMKGFSDILEVIRKEQIKLIKCIYNDFDEKVEKLKDSFKDSIEAIESLDFWTQTENERDSLKRKIVNIIKMNEPKEIFKK